MPHKVFVRSYQAHMLKVMIVFGMCLSSAPYLPEHLHGPEAFGEVPKRSGD